MPLPNGFVPRKNIMEGVVILHETIHELEMGSFSKLTEKTYDKVKWSFLQQENEDEGILLV